MRIEAATAADVYDVALHMRERDFQELTALMPTDDRATVAKNLTAQYGGREDIMAVFGDDECVCIGATIETRPGVVTALFFATDSFPSVAVPLTRFIRRELFPRLKAAGIHRIEAASLYDYKQMHRWLKVLGLAPETPPMAGYGKRGESFIQFAWSSYAGPAGT